MNIRVVNLQRQYRVNKEGVRRLVKYFLDCGSVHGRKPMWTEISVALMDNRGMERLNRRHLGRDDTTDVMAFHYVFPSVGGIVHVGEIAVNVELAAASLPQHAKPGRNPDRELVLYLAHGCDHLLGADDSTPAERSRMLRRERHWIRRADGNKLLCSLLLNLDREKARSSLRTQKRSGEMIQE
ncbi:MAG: rRNA maturation RNase YbeY [Kiritimatiellae bacterium]|nr:rRNA maturation RNase YbeY [Kiritimatiellia bacterium]